MLGNYFYHKRIRTSVAVFGTLFNNIYILKKNSAGDVISQQKVPLAYAPQAKFLERIARQSNLDTDSQLAIKLPRMSFEILAFDYDTTRQLPKTNARLLSNSDNTKRSKMFAPVPYNINFQLNVIAKNQDDALQIVEQILPYFNPQYTLTVKPIEDYPDIKEDCVIKLNGISFIDDYEGAVENRRTLIYTLDFTMKINFYGPVSSANIIRTANTEIKDYTNNYKIETITVVPDPTSAFPDSDFGFTTTIDLSYDDSA